MFNKLFGGGNGKGGGGPSTQATNKTVDAIQKLAETAELLEKRKEVLEKKIAAELQRAKAYMKGGNKNAALSCMKKKALWETQMNQIDNNIMRVHEQQSLLENQRTTVEIVAAMQQASQAQKATMAEFKIDNVDKVLEDIVEQNEQIQEINQALAQPLGPAAEIDEDDLLGQLEEMEAQSLEEDLLQPAAVPASKHDQFTDLLPDVPTQAARPAKAKTTEDELAELEAELAS